MGRTNISRWQSWTRPIKDWFTRGIRVDVADKTGSMASLPQLNFGVNVTNDGAMRLTAFFAGIRLISENVASLPKEVKVKKGRTLANDYDHAVNKILEKPNSYTNTFSFWQTISTWIKGWGNGYAIIMRNGAGTPTELHQVHPTWVKVVVSAGKKWYKVTATDPDFAFLNGMYPDYNMLHFMEMTLDGITGVNTVIYNAIALGKATATEKFAAEFFEKGGNIKAVMETDGNLGDNEYAKFMAHFSAAANNFETPLLEYGIKYKQLSVNPVAAQLIQSETLSIQDIARILNVPPHMIAELSHATFSNIEHQTIQFVQYSLRPIVKKIEVELRSKLFFADERAYKVKFSLDGLLRGDTAARSNFYHNAILDGYMSRNEVRDLEGLERAEGLDEFLYPLNTGIVGKENNTDNKDE